MTCQVFLQKVVTKRYRLAYATAQATTWTCGPCVLGHGRPVAAGVEDLPPRPRRACLRTWRQTGCVASLCRLGYRAGVESDAPWLEMAAEAVESAPLASSRERIDPLRLIGEGLLPFGLGRGIVRQLHLLPIRQPCRRRRSDVRASATSITASSLTVRDVKNQALDQREKPP